jgi:hypothetical protein
MPVFRDFSEEGRQAKLFGQWQRYSNQADLVVEVSDRPPIDTQKELAQLAIIKGVLDVHNPNNPTAMPS